VLTVNVVQKFGVNDFLERFWVLPPQVVEPLRACVEVTENGWVMNEWPMTEQIANIVQPWVDEPIDVETAVWFVGSWQERG